MCNLLSAAAVSTVGASNLLGVVVRREWEDAPMEAPQVGARADGGWFARLAARIGQIGAYPRDDDDLRNKKALLVLLAVLILPVSIVWGSSYLAFGSLVGILPFIYFSISVASLVFFAKTKRFMPFLIVQLLDVMLMT